jgi:hypothetical protein
MANDASLHSGKVARSHRETLCLRVVFGIYAAVLTVAGIFWRETCLLFHGVTLVWVESFQLLIQTRTLPSWDASEIAANGFFGFMAISAVLALQFVLHAARWGVRLPGRWLWRCTAAHAASAIAWWSFGVTTADRNFSFADWVCWIIPVFAIAATKLICAILVLREKRTASEGDDPSRDRLPRGA